MTNISVKAERDYEVRVVGDWHTELSAQIGDRRSYLLFPERLQASIPTNLKAHHHFALPDGEAQKTGQTFINVLEQMANIGLDRNTVVVGIGGGATTDLAGYVAASYLRGVNWIAVPTTVAGMVDAAVGGKTGINLTAGKNLVGAFHSPEQVLVDLSWVETLSPRDTAAGLVESVKCGFIADPKILDLIIDSPRKHLAEIVERSIRVKADVVSQDFKESHAREALNYGHTLGHAIERLSNYELRHGEAVSIGLVFAAYLSVEVAGLDIAIADQHRSILETLGMPTRYRADAFPELLELMARDKKRRDNNLRLVTLRNLGQTDRSSHFTDDILTKIYNERIAR